MLGTGVVLSGCAGVRHPRLAGDAYGKQDAYAKPGGGRSAADVARAREEACADWRWIAVKKDPAAACPVPRRGWSTRPGFDRAQRQHACGEKKHGAPAGISLAEATEQLDRFCVYETAKLGWWSPRRPFASARAAGLEKLDRDCAVIDRAWQQQVVDLASPSWKPFADNFLAQAGQAPTLNITQQGGGRLAFLDDEPTRETIPDAVERPRHRQVHGLTLANIARHLVCGGEPSYLSPCAAKITTRLALPVASFDPDDPQGTTTTPNGGHIGTQQNLADAIYAEVNAWKAARSQEAQQHLVLNLSLGWDPTILGDVDAAKLQAGSDAVYSALQYAQAEGALVVAAAGNQRECDSAMPGPVLPAGWEEELSSDATSNVPLIYAVGAMGWDNRPLSNTRGAGMPRRAAYGEHAVVAAVQDGLSTWMYSGSSVSTAVVSATAALVWDSFPNLSREQVMETLYQSGWDTKLEADFPGDSPRPAVKRVSVCNAIQSACAAATAALGTAAPCPLPEGVSCPTMPTYAVHSPDWAVSALSRSCNPWVNPQPDTPLCPPCRPPES